MAWPLVIAGASAVMKHDARNKQNASDNRWIHEEKKRIARQLRIQEAGARQNIADIDRQKERDKEITADQLVNTQLDFRDREIQQGMDMAWLQAQQAIDSTSYQSGPGAMGLAMGLGGAALDAYTFGQKVDSPSLGTNTGPK